MPPPQAHACLPVCPRRRSVGGSTRSVSVNLTAATTAVIRRTGGRRILQPGSEYGPIKPHPNGARRPSAGGLTRSTHGSRRPDPVDSFHPNL